MASKTLKKERESNGIGGYIALSDSERNNDTDISIL